jgi:hypothetical protein
MAWPWKKKEATVDYAMVNATNLQEIIDSAEISQGYTTDSRLHIQKRVELDKGLRHIVAQTDLTDDNVIMRKNAMSKLIEEEIKEIKAELVGVNGVDEELKKSKYNDLLRQADAQVEHNVNLQDHTQTLRLTDEENNTIRKDLVSQAKQAGLEYKRLAKDFNKSVNRLKVLSGALTTDLIESEQAHVTTLINMLKAHEDELISITSDMEKNPNVVTVNKAKKDIITVLSKYDARTELTRLDEIRTENTEIENNLKACFKEAGEIEDLDNQVRAKTFQIQQILTELRANTSYIVL